MKIGKIVLVVLSFICLELHAQIPQSPQQIKILNNYGAIPFEDGKTIVTEISFLGVDDKDEILKNLGYDRATISIGDKFYGFKVSKAVKSIRNLLASEGYDKAEIEAFGENLPTNQMKLIFAVKRGALARVSEIRFEGNQNLTNEELAANAKKCIGEGWEIFVARKYDYIANKCLRELMSNKGYLKSEIKNIIYQPSGDEKVVLIEVKEGLRYRIGKIQLEGLNAISKEQFFELFGQKQGDIIDGKGLRSLLYDRLSSFYKNRGYLLYDAEIDPDYVESKSEGEDGIINFKLIIDEGRQFRLQELEIVGTDKKSADKLRQMLLIRDGGIYESGKVKDWVDKINKMKKFDLIDFNKDTEIRVDEEGDTVLLVLKVKSMTKQNELRNHSIQYSRGSGTIRRN